MSSVKEEQLTVDLILAFVNVWVLPWVVPSKEECFEGQPASSNELSISGVKTLQFAKTFSKKLRGHNILRTNTAVQKIESRTIFKLANCNLPRLNFSITSAMLALK